MLLFIVFASIVVVGIVLIILGQKFWYDWDCAEVLQAVGIGFCILPSVVAGILGIDAGITNSTRSCMQLRIKYDGQVLELNKTYAILNNIKDEYAKYTAIQQYNAEVREFKTDILSHQVELNNPWINWYVCKEYRNLDANAVSYIE